MRTTFDIVDLVYNYLKGAAEMPTITGRICKSRPANSNNEDIVIGSLPISAEQVQKAIININIHVPNLTISVQGQQDDTAPNFKRLKALTDQVISIIDDKHFGDYWFSVQQQNLFADEVQGDHYANIRIEFYSENIL